MKNFIKKLGLVALILVLTAPAVLAQVSPGDLQRLRGYTLNMKSITATTGVFTTLTATNQVSTGSDSAPIQNAGSSGAAGTINVFPATAANGVLKITAVNNTGAFNSTLTNSNIGQATVYSLPDPGASTANVVVSAGAQSISAPLTFTGAETIGAGGSLVAKTSTSTSDIDPPFGTAILGNPVVKYAYGSCTVAAINGGTCIPLAATTARTISILNFDVVANGTPATCTGVLLEDTNGTPVVVSTLAVATLTSGAHNIPIIGTLGVGFGAGSGLTAAAGFQIIKNGSNCSTMTAMQYAITYTVQ